MRIYILVISLILLIITVGVLSFTMDKNYKMETNIRNVVTRFFSGGDEDKLELDSSKVPRGFIGTGFTELIWTVNKTGSEKYLDVSYENLNDNTTEFCITFNNKAQYEVDASFSNHQITDVPLDKTLMKENFTIPNTKIDSTKATDKVAKCFNVTYSEKVNGMQFKIGWESVLITSSIDTSNGFSDNKNRGIARDSDGNLFVGYRDISTNLAMANSSDDGNTWSTQIVKPAAMFRVVMLVDSQDNLYIVTENASVNSIILINSTDSGKTWSSALISNVGADDQEPSCEMDSQDIVHCCFIDDANDALYYDNSSNWGSPVAVNTNGADDTDDCDIEVDENDCVFIVGTGTDQYTTDIWSPCLDGWGDSNRVEINDGDYNEYPSITINKNNEIYVSWDAGGQYEFANSSDGGSTWSVQKNIDSAYYRQDIVVSEENHIYTFASEGEGTTVELRFINSSDNGSTWDVDNVVATQYGTYPTIVQARHPDSMHLEGVLRFAFINDTGLQYSSFIIPYTEAEDETPPVITHLTNDSTTNISSNINWSTDEDANYSIQLYSNISVFDYSSNDFNLNHTANFSGLINYTTYIINLSVWDSSGNLGTNTSNFSFTTAQFIGVDTTAPTITHFTNDSTTNISSNINWTCSEDCNFSVSIWNNSEFMEFSANVFAMNWSVNFTGLTNATTYYTNLTTWDSEGNKATNLSNMTFNTSQFVGIPAIGWINVTQIFPITNMDVTRHVFFNYTTRTCCYTANCGEINISLDPSSLIRENITLDDDTYISSANPDTNYGSDNLFKVGSCGSSCFLDGYVKFNTTSFYNSGRIIYEVLFCSHIYDELGYTEDGNSIYLYNITGDWNETNITWNYNPSSTGVLLYINTSLTNSSWICYNATNHFKNNMNFRYNLSFRWRNGINPSAGYLYFDSKERGTNNESYMQVTYKDNIKLGLVSTEEYDIPFYTNISNPNTTILSKDECVEFSWWVNATGNNNNSYMFYTYANSTDTPNDIHNKTGEFNITIFDAPCFPSWMNTSWSDYFNYSCTIQDNLTSMINLTMYDENNCDLNNVTFYNYTNGTCDYCLINITNTSWSDYFNYSCTIQDNLTSITNRTEWDTNRTTCFGVTALASDDFTNVTHYNYTNITCDYCLINITNTSWSSWINASCDIADNASGTRNLTQWDSNRTTCFGVTSLATDDYTNVTYYNHTKTDCDYCLPNVTNTSWSDYFNYSCTIQDNLTSITNRTEWDTNRTTCFGVTGLPADDYTNVTYYNYTNVTCDYCLYDITNTSWLTYFNYSCTIEDNLTSMTNLTEYDQNISTCYAVTESATDLWNSQINITFYNYTNITCDYCLYDPVNSTIGEYTNFTCMANATWNITRNITRYDQNISTCYAVTGLETDLWNELVNITYSNYSTDGFCVYDAVAPIITNLRNETTTNDTTYINWDTDEDTNFSISIWNGTNIFETSSGVFNNTKITFFEDLMNGTTYYVNLSVWDYSRNIATNLTNFSFKTAQTPDIQAPTITHLTNDSTTNVSSNINWSCSENCNYSVSIWNNSFIMDSYANVFVQNWSVNFSGLTNNTAYYINLSVWDSSGNIVTNLSNFSFTTVQYTAIPIQAIHSRLVIEVFNFSNFQIVYNATMYIISNSTGVKALEITPDGTNFIGNKNIDNLSINEMKSVSWLNYSFRGLSDVWFNTTQFTATGDAKSISNNVSLINPIDPPHAFTKDGIVDCDLNPIIDTDTTIGFPLTFRNAGYFMINAILKATGFNKEGADCKVSIKEDEGKLVIG